MGAEEIINKASAEKKIIMKKFHTNTFKKLFGLWLLGGILALLPTGLSFLLNPIEKLTLWQFFGDMEIIYVCVTMAIVLICDLVLKRINLFFWVNLLTIVIGSLIYGLLKSNVPIPIFNVSNNFPIFNFIFLLFVFLIGILSYINISFEGEVVYK